MSDSIAFFAEAVFLQSKMNCDRAEKQAIQHGSIVLLSQVRRKKLYVSFCKELVERFGTPVEMATYFRSHFDEFVLQKNEFDSYRFFIAEACERSEMSPVVPE
jgi:hypothetical protein